MNRRLPLAVVSAGIAVMLLTVAASSDSSRIWITPTATRTPSSGGSAPVTTVGTQIPASSDRTEVPSWIGALLPIVGLLLIGIIVIATASVRVARPHRQFGWRRGRWWRVPPITPLPEVSERELSIDVEAAAAALSEGAPRNAIIGCWMQLERDAAKVGLQRMGAETPAEYVERVVVASSIDPVPIRELAAIYREARFSLHKLDNEDREHALDALHRVEAALRHKRKVPA
jgi:hypothetical protein